MNCLKNQEFFPELISLCFLDSNKIILEKDYASHSAAYKAVGREFLKKISKAK